jgi:methylated-DNA-protein-cysteine methyltransferase-like protein
MVDSLNNKHKDFFQSVFDVIRLIPEGRVTSYGAIAKYLGSAKSSRMVGWALNASHKLADVPAHRVVNRNGLLTGKFHFETLEMMETKLKNEGFHVEHDQIVNFKVLFWDPNKELRID